MMIQADGEIYFIDRDNSVFQVNGLTFPIRETYPELSGTHCWTA